MFGFGVMASLSNRRFGASWVSPHGCATPLSQTNATSQQLLGNTVRNIADNQGGGLAKTMPSQMGNRGEMVNSSSSSSTPSSSTLSSDYFREFEIAGHAQQQQQQSQSSRLSGNHRPQSSVPLMERAGSYAPESGTASSSSYGSGGNVTPQDNMLQEVETLRQQLAVMEARDEERVRQIQKSQRNWELSQMQNALRLAEVTLELRRSEEQVATLAAQAESRNARRGLASNNRVVPAGMLTSTRPVGLATTGLLLLPSAASREVGAGEMPDAMPAKTTAPEAKNSCDAYAERDDYALKRSSAADAEPPAVRSLMAPSMARSIGGSLHRVTDGPVHCLALPRKQPIQHGVVVANDPCERERVHSREVWRESRQLSQASTENDVSRQALRPTRRPLGAGLLGNLATADTPCDLRSFGLRAVPTGAASHAAKPPLGGLSYKKVGSEVFSLSIPPASAADQAAQRSHLPAQTRDVRSAQPHRNAGYQAVAKATAIKNNSHDEDPSYCVSCAYLHNYRVCPACGTRRALVKTWGGEGDASHGVGRVPMGNAPSADVLPGPGETFTGKRKKSRSAKKMSFRGNSQATCDDIPEEMTTDDLSLPACEKLQAATTAAAHAYNADESLDQSSDSDYSDGFTGDSSSSASGCDDETSNDVKKTFQDSGSDGRSDSTPLSSNYKGRKSSKRLVKASHFNCEDLLERCSNKGFESDPNIIVDENEMMKSKKHFVKQSDGTLADAIDLFGPMFKPEINTSTYWDVKKESKVYKFKELEAALKLPSLPNNISQFKEWMSTVQATLASYDMSTSGVLSHWWAMLEHPTGHVSEELVKYHSNAQGLILLDRLLGRLLATKYHFKHPVFGRQFKTYVMWSWSKRDAPSGRAIVAAMGVRFRVHRHVSNSVNIRHLYQIELPSYDDNAVATFMDEVRRIFCQLTPSDIEVEGCGVDFTFQWLWNKIKNWKRIKHEVRKIRRVKPTHRKRTWQHLWSVMSSALAARDEDRNEDDLNATIHKHQDIRYQSGQVHLPSSCESTAPNNNTAVQSRSQKYKERKRIQKEKRMTAYAHAASSHEEDLAQATAYGWHQTGESAPSDQSQNNQNVGNYGWYQTGEPSPSDQPRRAIKRINLPKGILDSEILANYTAIAQQTNCIGCYPAGLAEDIARVLPYGCSYKKRRPNLQERKFSIAIEEDHSEPGTIDIRRPPSSNTADSNDSPIVINMMAQWELGPALKYSRARCPKGPDSIYNREKWFQMCLDKITDLGEDKPASIAFPHKIGCGLAGGNWQKYDAMIQTFANRNPEIQVTIARWLGRRWRRV